MVTSVVVGILYLFYYFLLSLRRVCARLACRLVLVLKREPFFNTCLAKAAVVIPARLAFALNAPGRLIAFLMKLRAMLWSF